MEIGMLYLVAQLTVTVTMAQIMHDQCAFNCGDHSFNIISSITTQIYVSSSAQILHDTLDLMGNVCKGVAPTLIAARVSVSRCIAGMGNGDSDIDNVTAIYAPSRNDTRFTRTRNIECAMTTAQGSQPSIGGVTPESVDINEKNITSGEGRDCDQNRAADVSQFC